MSVDTINTIDTKAILDIVDIVDILYSSYQLVSGYYRSEEGATLEPILPYLSEPTPRHLE